jgi:hypothetical protein
MIRLAREDLPIDRLRLGEATGLVMREAQSEAPCAVDAFDMSSI